MEIFNYDAAASGHPERGIVRDMPNDIYHASTYLSSSRIRAADRSVAHMFTPFRETAAMRLGSAVHSLVLEPQHFDRDFAWFLSSPQKPDLDLRTKEGKAWRDSEEGQAWEFESARVKEHNAHVQAGNRAILKEDQVTTARIMAAALESHPAWIAGRSPEALVEASFFAPPSGGYSFGTRARFDLIDLPGDGFAGCATDIKTTKDASPKGFIKSVVNFGYHVQEAFYRRVYEELLNEQLGAFYFAAVESSAPFSVAWYEIPDDGKDEGERALTRLLERYEDWLQSGDSTPPGYPAGIQVLDWPRWAYTAPVESRVIVDRAPEYEDALDLEGFDEDDDEDGLSWDI